MLHSGLPSIQFKKRFNQNKSRKIDIKMTEVMEINHTKNEKHDFSKFFAFYNNL